MTQLAHPGRWMLVGIVAWLSVAVTGVQSARQSGEMRDLFQRLSTNQQTQDGLLAEYRLLLLERATLAAYQNVERIAAEELDMGFPQEVRQVERWRRGER